MKLKDYIEKHGTKASAKKFGVSEITAYQWKSHRRLPEPGLMMVIVKRTKGLVTYREIIEDYFNSKK